MMCLSYLQGVFILFCQVSLYMFIGWYMVVVVHGSVFNCVCMCVCVWGGGGGVCTCAQGHGHQAHEVTPSL